VTLNEVGKREVQTWLTEVIWGRQGECAKATLQKQAEVRISWVFLNALEGTGSCLL
jgi:single-stranded DNA-binding protein